MKKNNFWKKELIKNAKVKAFLSSISKIVLKTIVGIIALGIVLLLLINIIGAIADMNGRSLLNKHKQEFSTFYEEFEKKAYDNSKGQYDEEIAENAWNYYSAGAKRYKEILDDKGKDYSKNYPAFTQFTYETGLNEEMISHLKDFEGIEKYILDGARCEYFLLPIDFENYSYDTYSSTVNIFQLIRYIGVLAAYYMDLGKTDEAIELIKAGFYVSIDYERGNIELMSKALSNRYKRILLNTILYGIMKNAFVEKHYDEIVKLLEYEKQNRCNIHNFLKNEPIILFYETPKIWELFSWHESPDHINIPKKFRYHNYARILSVRSFFSPYLETSRYIRKNKDYIDKIKECDNWNCVNTHEIELSKIGFLAELLFDSNLDYFIFQNSTLKTELKMLRIAALLQAYKLKNGNYPDSITNIDYEYLTETITDNLSSSSIIYSKIDNNKADIKVDIEKVKLPGEFGRRNINVFTSKLVHYRIKITGAIVHKLCKLKRCYVNFA